MNPNPDRSMRRREFLAALAMAPVVLAILATGGLARLFGKRSQADAAPRTEAPTGLPPGAVVLTEAELTGPHNLAG
ncbi:MAG: hypothetical protein J7M25_05565 [Deltaproteobacteria bacterium]|nr:hypothetical protein [Deltaproteobacteria bacterium]